MKLCVVSKYPPLEGQVSTVNYWLVQGLAQRGHEVVVVTNAGEADTTCRHFDYRSGPGSAAESSTSDRVRILNTTPYSPEQFYVPWSNPFVTKLAGLALEAVREAGCDVVFSHYLEPYSVAGHLAATWARVPHVATHSGSDVARLMRSELRAAYLEVARNADVFVAKSSAIERLLGRGKQGSAERPAPYSPPPEYFRPSAVPLDVERLLSEAAGEIRESLRWHTKVPDRRWPTLGYYGKLFEVKGVYDLIAALGLLAQRGTRVNLLLMSRWRRGEERLREAIIAAGLYETTWLLPFLPNWEIPGFIRRCDGIAYLEREWPIGVHTPIIPKEVLWCGGCLLVSEEVRSHPWYREALSDGCTAMVVLDPTDHERLASRLAEWAASPELRSCIATGAQRAVGRLGCYERFVSSWERILQSGRTDA